MTAWFGWPVRQTLLVLSNQNDFNRKQCIGNRHINAELRRGIRRRIRFSLSLSGNRTALLERSPWLDVQLHDHGNDAEPDGSYKDIPDKLLPLGSLGDVYLQEHRERLAVPS